MPTLADLKTELERVLKDPHLKVETYARPLRKTRLITIGGRGSSAPQITPRDATNLLIAILSPAPAIKGVETVKQYRSIYLLRRPPGARGDRSTRPQRTRNLEDRSLKDIRYVHFLGDVIELLIRQAADGAMERLAAQWTGGPNKPGLSLKIIGPRPAAVLRVPMLGDNWINRTFAYAREDQKESPSTAGIVRASEIYADVLIAIGKLFRDN
jgi:hypothetical protein